MWAACVARNERDRDTNCLYTGIMPPTTHKCELLVSLRMRDRYAFFTSNRHYAPNNRTWPDSPQACGSPVNCPKCECHNGENIREQMCCYGQCPCLPITTVLRNVVVLRPYSPPQFWSNVVEKELTWDGRHVTPFPKAHVENPYAMKKTISAAQFFVLTRIHQCLKSSHIPKTYSGHILPYHCNCHMILMKFDWHKKTFTYTQIYKFDRYNRQPSVRRNRLIWRLIFLMNIILY